MSQRVILITAANGGLGRGIARVFLDEPADNFVWLAVHQKRDAVDEIIQQHADRAAVIQLDVTSCDDWQRALKEITQRQGRLDVLVNNAGFHQDMLLAQMPQETWRQVLSVNLDGVFHGCQAVLPTMISQRGGRIINVASLSALTAPAGQTNYAAAKAGVVALTQSLAKEVARLGITVNAVCPGYIDTESLASMDADARKAAQARIPMRRFGKPEEVAAAVRFLACSEAAYITGSALKIDGGIL